MQDLLFCADFVSIFLLGNCVQTSLSWQLSCVFEKYFAVFSQRHCSSGNLLGAIVFWSAFASLLLNYVLQQIHPNRFPLLHCPKVVTNTK